MIRIFPFNAIRPSQSHVSQVAVSVNGTESDEQIKRIMETNPFSYLHVVKPQLHFGAEKADNEQHMLLARSYFNQLLEQNVLLNDELPSVYIYRQIAPDGSVYEGLILGVSAIDYLEGSIKKHENTLLEKEERMVMHVQATGGVGEPVLLSCPDNQVVKQWIALHKPEKHLFKFNSANNETHELWSVTDTQAIAELQNRFKAIESLYIADGHHRIAASSIYLTRMHSEQNWASGKMHFMALVLPEEDLNIKSFHRLVKGIGAEGVEKIVQECKTKFWIEKSDEPVIPEHKGEFGMITADGWYRLEFRNRKTDYGTAAQNLDVSRLEQYVFHDILEFSNSNSDPRLSFVRGDMTPSELSVLINSKLIDVAFLLYPNTMAEIKEVADESETMPPKSTWVEPKLLTGMIIQKY